MRRNLYEEKAYNAFGCSGTYHDGHAGTCFCCAKTYTYQVITTDPAQTLIPVNKRFNVY